MKIGSIVIKCRNFDRMLAFWQEALHYAHKKPMKSGFAIMHTPQGGSPNISLDLALDGEHLGSSTNPRLHLDLYTDDQEDEVKRLLKIGATRRRQKYDSEDDFIVLDDPDSDLFCVVHTTR